jgi:uncharacterized membrane protein
MNIMKDLKQAKLLGHPVHMMIIHFPIGLIPVSLVFDLIGLNSNDAFFAKAGYYCLTLGLFSAILSALFGFMDFLRIPENKPNSRRKGLIHMFLNITWIFMAATVWALRLNAVPTNYIESATEVIITAVAVLIMLISNHFGGDLVIKEGIGTTFQDHE